MKVLAYLPDLGGCGFYRQLQPLAHMDARPGPNDAKQHIKNSSPSHGTVEVRKLTFNRWKSPETGGPELLRWADVVLASRIQSVGIIQNIRDYNPEALLVFDLDDYLLATPEENLYTQTVRPAHFEALKANLEQADLVTVSTPELAKLLAEYSDNIEIVRNTIDPKLFTMPQYRKDHIRIGWAGSSTHVRDVEPAIQGLKMALDEWNSKTSQKYGSGRGVENSTEGGSGMPPGACLAAFMGHLGRIAAKLWAGEKIYWQPPVAFESYYSNLRGLALDIGLAPIRPHVFNRAKSDIKFLEYSAMGALTIATDFGPYSESIEHEKTGLLVKKHEDPKCWRDLILYALEEPGMTEEIVSRARSWCLEERNPGKESERLANLYYKNLQGKRPKRKRIRVPKLIKRKVKGEEPLIRIATVSWIPEPDERLTCMKKCLPVILARIAACRTPATYHLLMQGSCREATEFAKAEIKIAQERGLDAEIIIKEENRGVPAINGFFNEAAAEPYFIKIDDDVVPAPGFLDVMLEVYQELAHTCAQPDPNGAARAGCQSAARAKNHQQTKARATKNKRLKKSGSALAGDTCRLGMLSYDPHWAGETFGTREMFKCVSHSVITRSGHHVNFLLPNSTAVGMCRMESRESYLETGGHPEGQLYGTDQLMADAYTRAGYVNAHLIPMYELRPGRSSIITPEPLQHLGPTSPERKKYKQEQLRKMTERRRQVKGQATMTPALLLTAKGRKKNGG